MPVVSHHSKAGGGDAMPRLGMTQIATYHRLADAKDASALVVLEAPSGFGKTTLLNLLQGETGAKCITASELMSAIQGSPHAGIEQAFSRLLHEALDKHSLVIVDDLDLIFKTAADDFYPRRGLMAGLVHAAVDRAHREGKCILCSGCDFSRADVGYPEMLQFEYIERRMMMVSPPPLTVDDFAFFLGLELPPGALTDISFKRLHKQHTTLNGHQLRLLGALISARGSWSEDAINELVGTQINISNAQIGEVAGVRFSDLKGLEHLVEELTTYVLTPLTAGPRYDGLGLAPKRGVLLFGPPGTGKTSIGRALAHQMQGKFFMIDGTVPTEPAKDFYPRIKAIFDAAKKAAPCVVFIDDADVLFQSDRSTGLTRYLLTMLDGLESETAGKVAVMMTAMDPNHMPPALLRSGRVELWLETKPPSDIARAEIIAADATSLPEQLRNYKFEALADITAGFNAADMRRIVADVKALYARDVVENRKPKPADQYFAAAAEGVRDNKVLLGLAETGNLKLTPSATAERA